MCNMFSKRQKLKPSKLQQLQRVIIDSVLECPHLWPGSSFLPQDKFDELLNDNDIRDVLGRSRIKKDIHNEIIKTLKKTFAILTLIDMVPTIQAIFKSGFKDEHIPLYYKSSESPSGLVPGTKFIDKGVLNGFRLEDGWGYSKGLAFFEKQYLFLAPTFKGEIEHDDILSDKHPLPFTYVARKPAGEGGFGRVYQGCVHRKHQNVLPSVTYSQPNFL